MRAEHHTLEKIALYTYQRYFHGSAVAVCTEGSILTCAVRPFFVPCTQPITAQFGHDHGLGTEALAHSLENTTLFYSLARYLNMILLAKVREITLEIAQDTVFEGHKAS